MVELSKLSLEELERQYRDASFYTRYYHNTDDQEVWKNEAAERKAANARYASLVAEYKRRQKSPPQIP